MDSLATGSEAPIASSLPDNRRFYGEDEQRGMMVLAEAICSDEAEVARCDRSCCTAMMVLVVVTRNVRSEETTDTIYSTFKVNVSFCLSQFEDSGSRDA